MRSTYYALSFTGSVFYITIIDSGSVDEQTYMFSCLTGWAPVDVKRTADVGGVEYYYDLEGVIGRLHESNPDAVGAFVGKFV